MSKVRQRLGTPAWEEVPPGGSPRSRLIAPLLLAAALAVYLFIGYVQGRARTVWLVNGLTRDYDVSLNGQRVHLAAGGAQPIHLPEGLVRIESLDPSLPLADRTCDVSTPLLTRPFSRRTLVLNPDRTALVYEQESGYRDSAADAAKNAGAHRLYVGQLLYRFARVDYLFSDFPDSLEVKDPSPAVHKKRVAVWTAGTIVQRMAVIGHELGREAQAAYARNQAIYNPDDQQLLALAATLSTDEESISFLGAGLDKLPPRIEWHRKYQDAMMRAHPEIDVELQYRARLDHRPRDAGLMYLLGRVVKDHAEAMSLFHRSAEAPDPCAYGLHALAYDALAHARFEAGLDYARRALALLPGNDRFVTTETESLTALRRYDELLSRAGDQLEKDPGDLETVLRTVRLLALRGQPAEARRTAARFVALTARAGQPDAARRLALRAQALLRYLDGDEEGCASVLRRVAGDPKEKFEAAICLGRLDEASAALAADPAASAADHLLIYIAARAAGQSDLATANLKLAADAYRRGNRQERQVGQWLADAARPYPNLVADAELVPSQKRLVLMAMGLRDESKRDLYFGQAAALNYDRAFPYWTLKRVLDGNVAAAD